MSKPTTCWLLRSATYRVPPLQVLLEDGRHLLELMPRERDVAREALA